MYCFLSYVANLDIFFEIRLIKIENIIQVDYFFCLLRTYRTDKDDEPELEFDKIVPQNFELTDNPTVIGIQKVPGLRDRIRKLEKKYGDTKIEDADYEEIKEESDGDAAGS